MSALPKFRVVGGRDQHPNSLAEARKHARPLLRYWMRKVEKAVLSGRLLPIDLMLAKELTNYPSANEGRCYAGQKRLGAAIARSDRTARECLKRLCQDGLLACKRGGPGRTASWTFCFKSTPIFGGELRDAPAAPPVESIATAVQDRKPAAQDRKSTSGLDRKSASDKPSELKHDIECKPSPLPPVVPSGTAVGLPTKKEEEAGPVVDGEVISGAISFQEFWLAAGRRGAEGFARAEWRKLSNSDIAAISDRLRRDGRLRMRNIWAGVWLRDRVWEEPPEPLPEIKFHPRPPVTEALPGSDLWRAERERRRAAGESTKLIDE